MEKEKFIELMKPSAEISTETNLQLKELLEAFPYFQAARALRLKGLKQNQSFSYNTELKKTAAYTTNRGVLFDYITSPEFNQDHISEEIKDRELSVQKQQDIDKGFDKSVNMNIAEANQILDPALFENIVSSQQLPEEKELQLGKPLEFNKEEAHSFSEWLKLTQAKPIQRETIETPQVEETEKPEEKSRKFKLIDQFIAKNPKISSPKDVSFKRTENQAETSKNRLMTETLARVYLEQKNYSKAIQAYKILILKNPEKSSFFADQIQSIEKLQENKNQ